MTVPQYSQTITRDRSGPLGSTTTVDRLASSTRLRWDTPKAMQSQWMASFTATSLSFGISDSHRTNTSHTIRLVTVDQESLHALPDGGVAWMWVSEAPQ